MKLGVIGVGRIGAHHAGVLRCLAGVEVVHAIDAVPGAATRVSAELGLVAFDTSDELIKSGIDGIDGLVIASSTPTHPEFILAAVEAGIRTFCEKPIAGNPRAAQALRDQTAAPTFQSTSGSIAASTQAMFGPRKSCSRATSASCTRSARWSWTRRPRRQTTLPSPAGSTTTARSTTSTPFAGSRTARWSRSSPREATGAKRSSPRPVTWTPARRS